MNVSDVIQRQIEHVRTDDLVERAAIILFANNTDTVPVCLGKKVVGVITRENIYKHVLNTKDSKNNNTPFLSIPITKIMTKGLTVTPETTLLRAHTIMDDYDVQKLPVVDNLGRLIGAVSKVDVFRALIGQKNLFPESNEQRDFVSGTRFSSVNWKNRFKRELPDLLSVFKKNNVKTILDVGCGTGEFSIELANQGYSVIGIDRNSNMIEQANKNKLKLRRKSTGNVSFWNKEAEDFLFDFDTTFDAIIFMNNSISHNPHNFRHIIKRCSNSLTENGVMILQISNFKKTLEVNKRFMNFYKVRPEDENREYAFLEFLDNPVHDKTVLKNFIILVSEGDDWQWSGMRSILMAYSDEERMRSILKQEGFTKIETFGPTYDLVNWDGFMEKPFNPLKSDWLNVIATKS